MLLYRARLRDYPRKGRHATADIFERAELPRLFVISPSLSARIPPPADLGKIYGAHSYYTVVRRQEISRAE